MSPSFEVPNPRSRWYGIPSGKMSFWNRGRSAGGRIDALSVVVVVPPLHTIRAFVSTVSPAVREYPELNVWSAPSWPLSWVEEVICFQNKPAARRADQFPSEFEKMERYLAKGDHLSAEEVIRYLNWRDSE